MASTRLIQPFESSDGEQGLESAEAVRPAPAAAAGVRSPAVPVPGQGAKAPRMHFFRGTFKLFGLSMNACFAALFVVDYLTMAYLFNALVAQNGLSFYFAAVASTGMVCMGLYDSRQRERVFGVLFHLIAALALSLLASVALVNLVGAWQISGYDILHATAWSFLFLASFRYLFHVYIDGRILRRRVVVLGTGKRAKFIQRLRRKADQRGFELVGFVTTNTCQHCYVNSDKLISLDTTLCDYALNHQIDEIVIAPDDRRAGLPTDDLLDCRMSGIKVTKDLDFFEREASLIQLEVIRPGWLIHAKGFNSNSFRYLEKRLFDVLGAAVLLLLLSPVMLVAALAILLECGMRAPIFYSQERVGRGGRTFTLFKFRSMGVDAEANGQAQWAAESDPRVTRVGGVLRKYRIDEIPQLWNVLCGDMSLVGPRPERPQFVEGLCDANAFYRERHRVAPGLTGWAQLCFPYGASEKDSIEKLKFDLYYIKNHGLIFDLYILAQTAEVVLFQRGSR